MTPLKDKEVILYESQKIGHIYKEKFCYDRNKKSEFALYHKSEIIAITPGNLEELLILFGI